MAKFGILVTHAPFDAQHAYSAHQFALSVLKGGHSLSGVFFYQAGIHNANSYQRPHSDELNMLEKWKQLTEQHMVPLQVCVTAANRRGLLSEEDARDSEQSDFNLDSAFQEVGLGDLVELMNSTDRLVQF